MASLINSAGASGTGSMTIQGPNTNSNQVLTIPDATGTLLTNASSGAVIAMVQFTVSGGVVTVRNSFNVTGVTRTGTGIYSVAFTSSVGSNPYITTSGGGVAGVYDAFSTISATAPTGTTAIVIGVGIPALALVDLGTCTVIAYKI